MFDNLEDCILSYEPLGSLPSIFLKWAAQMELQSGKVFNHMA